MVTAISITIWNYTSNPTVSVSGGGGRFFNCLHELQYYLNHTNEDVQTLTLNDYTFITNELRQAMSSTVETVRPPEVFIDLRATSYARQYALNLYDNTTTTTETSYKDKCRSC